MSAARSHQAQAVESGKSAFASESLHEAQVIVRPVRRSDLVLIEEMHRRLSKESIHYRYLSLRAPDPEYLQRLCFLDSQPGLAMVATVQEPGEKEKVVGMACFGVDPRDAATAEPAILVEDRYQGCGVGKRLALALGQQADQMGLKRFVCFIQPGNGRVLRLIERSGMRCESRYNQGLREVRVWLRRA